MGLHEDVNTELATLKKEEDLDKVQLAYDGQVLNDLPLLPEDGDTSSSNCRTADAHD